MFNAEWLEPDKPAQATAPDQWATLTVWQDGPTVLYLKHEVDGALAAERASHQDRIKELEEKIKLLEGALNMSNVYPGDKV